MHVHNTSLVGPKRRSKEISIAYLPYYRVTIILKLWSGWQKVAFLPVRPSTKPKLYCLYRNLTRRPRVTWWPHACYQEAADRVLPLARVGLFLWDKGSLTFKVPPCHSGLRLVIARCKSPCANVWAYSRAALHDQHLRVCNRVAVTTHLRIQPPEIQ